MSTTHIPFDIFPIIFSYYEETSGFPLETLLFVSRSWKMAALASKHIWSNFDIYISEDSKAVFWSRNIPRRLERSGPNSPIYFSFSTGTAPLKHTINLLQAILGPDGSLCARWREISLRNLQEEPQRILFFQYPTPHLSFLRIEEVVYRPGHTAFLPSTPSLREFETENCWFPYLPDLCTVKEFRYIDHYRDHTEWVDRTGATTSIKATQLHCLELDARGSSEHYKIPTNLLSLKRLHLAGDALPCNIKEVQTPVLRELSLKFEDDRRDRPPIKDLVKCTGIPFRQIETLILEFGDQMEVTMTDKHWNGYTALLQLCTGLKQVLVDYDSMIFLLKLLMDDCMGMGTLTDRTIPISYDGEIKEIRSGREERLEEIETYTTKLGWLEIGKMDRFELIRKLYPYAEADDDSMSSYVDSEDSVSPL